MTRRLSPAELRARAFHPAGKGAATLPEGPDAVPVATPLRIVPTGMPASSDPESPCLPT